MAAQLIVARRQYRLTVFEAWRTEKHEAGRNLSDEAWHIVTSRGVTGPHRGRPHEGPA